MRAGAFDALDADRAKLLATCVPGETVKNALVGMPAKVILVLDACHAGAVGTFASQTSGLVADLQKENYGVIVMCSATGS